MHPRIIFAAGFLILFVAPRGAVRPRPFCDGAFGCPHGLITMVHQIFGAIGDYAGAWIFDATKPTMRPSSSWQRRLGWRWLSR
jgi:hypothetical protein